MIYLILQVLNCGEKINSIKFDKYAKETAELYVQLYGWYYMPASVHKILFHGAHIINHFQLMGVRAVAMLTEESQESRNKDVKYIRRFNTRKCSRVASMSDLFHKLLISSDPYISSMRYKMKNPKLPISDEAKKLLVFEENS